jgi:hypothetical protein
MRGRKRGPEQPEDDAPWQGPGVTAPRAQEPAPAPRIVDEDVYFLVRGGPQLQDRLPHDEPSDAAPAKPSRKERKADKKEAKKAGEKRRVRDYTLFILSVAAFTSEASRLYEVPMLEYIGNGGHAAGAFVVDASCGPNPWCDDGPAMPEAVESSAVFNSIDPDTGEADMSEEVTGLASFEFIPPEEGGIILTDDGKIGVGMRLKIDKAKFVSIGGELNENDIPVITEGEETRRYTAVDYFADCTDSNNPGGSPCAADLQEFIGEAQGHSGALTEGSEIVTAEQLRGADDQYKLLYDEGTDTAATEVFAWAIGPDGKQWGLTCDLAEEP